MGYFKQFEDLCGMPSLKKTGDLRNKEKLNEFTKRYTLCIASEGLYRRTNSFEEYLGELASKMGIDKLTGKEKEEMRAGEIVNMKKALSKRVQ